MFDDRVRIESQTILSLVRVSGKSWGNGETIHTDLWISRSEAKISVHGGFTTCSFIGSSLNLDVGIIENEV